jgi:hypothetical protein
VSPIVCVVVLARRPERGSREERSVSATNEEQKPTRTHHHHHRVYEEIYCISIAKAFLSDIKKLAFFRNAYIFILQKIQTIK